MSFRVARILLACGTPLLLVACATRAAVVDLDAEPSTQPAPQPKPAAVARVLDADILAADLTGTTHAERCRQLALRLRRPLYLAYAQENNITADETEINECQAAFARLTHRASIPEDFARDKIIQYKFDRQLYHTYGGEVVFRRHNPFQPVGAYRAFLKEQERLGRFEIVDNDYVECFWDQFSTAKLFVWPESKVDFSQPWWMRTPE